MRNDGVALLAQTLTTIFTTLHSFDFTDGFYPQAALVQATDGNLYGTTADIGVNDGGTVFKITPGGTLTTLYSFCSQSNCTDGIEPVAAVVEARDRNFYGTTYYGGATGQGGDSGDGTVFKVTSGGELTTLHSFDGIDGANPAGGLVQPTYGDFYGTTAYGGAMTGRSSRSVHLEL